MTTSPRESVVSDETVEQIVGRLLQVGVLIAAAVVLVGGVLVLMQHGHTAAAYAAFRGEPEALRSLGGIVHGALALRSEAIVQLGLLLLIATPIARVAFTLVAFALQRDVTYVCITALVLALLLFGLVFGKG